MTWWGRGTISGLWLSLLCFPSSSIAQFYKCVDMDGNTTYSQTPCSASSGSEGPHAAGRESGGKAQVCAASREFGVDVAKRMRRGNDSRTEFDTLGGINAISKGALNIINYVHSFRVNPDIPAVRIGSLVQAKCRNGAFGRLSYADLPSQYDPSYGQEWPGTGSPAPENEIMEQEYRDYSSSNRQTGQVPAKNPRCNAYEQKLEAIDERMRRGYGAGEGNELRRERRRYKKFIRENC